MKTALKTIKIILYFSFTLFLLTGCEKDMSSKTNAVNVNEVMVTPLRSAFVGGGIADPSVGTSHRLHIYEGKYTEGPKWNEVKEKVFVSGFCYNGKDYSNLGDCIELIRITDLPSIGDLSIPLIQGKYEGGHELVSSVSINKYSFGSYDEDGSQTENSQINIHIVLTNKETIDILFTGSTPYDGYY